MMRELAAVCLAIVALYVPILWALTRAPSSEEAALNAQADRIFARRVKIASVLKRRWERAWPAVAEWSRGHLRVVR